MSSDGELERILREGRTKLPGPDGDATRAARARALVPRRRSRGVRAAALVGVALVVAIGLGVGIGSLIAPSGTAASPPIGFGFLPEPGWQALQAAAPWAPGQPQVAMAANVPFAADDVVHGLAEPSALPYSTLLTLPSRGIVIVASFTPRDPYQPAQPSTRYPPRKLPLRVRDATPYIEYGTQLRPEQPLGQHQLRAVLDGHYLDIYLYFGTPDPTPALLAAAQRQLDGLVVAGTAPEEPARAVRQSRPAEPSAPGVIDRTFACTPSLLGGIRQIDLRAHRGSGRRGGTWDRPAFAAVETSLSGSAATSVENELVWVSAGSPSTTATVRETMVGFTFPMRTWGTVAVNGKQCRRSAARVPLSRSGLSGGGAAGAIDDRWDCATGRRVLVRVRAVLGSRGTLRTFRGFLRTTQPVREASLAVRTPSGTQLALAQVFQSGKSLLYTSPTCFPD